jgi:hypothetical protein
MGKILLDKMYRGDTIGINNDGNTQFTNVRVVLDPHIYDSIITKNRVGSPIIFNGGSAVNNG